MSGDLARTTIDALERLFGRHAHARRAHAKGTFCRGTFTATPAGRGLCRAAHMRGERVPALVRFSNAPGDPRVPDFAHDVRGMAVKLEPPGDGATDIVAATGDTFFVRTPEDFLKLTNAQTGLGRVVRIPVFLATHPESWRAIRGALTLGPPESFATLRYDAIHAFRWTAPDGTERWVRYTWLPEAGERTIGVREAKRRGAGYLAGELRERLAGGTARFRLEVTIAAPGDPTDDPTRRWPGDRERVVAGTLELTEAVADPEAGGAEPVVFDPTRVGDGIGLSDDPILRFRPRAYSESVERRSA